MPENEKTNRGSENNGEDDVRARFAHLEEQAMPENDADELPPVPVVNYERPQTQTARTTRPGEVRGRGLGTGGLIGSANDVKGSGQALTIGTGLVGSIVAGTLLGWLADKYLLHSTTTPWGLIVGFLLGVTSGFINLVRVANRLNKD